MHPTVLPNRYGVCPTGFSFGPVGCFAIGSLHLVALQIPVTTNVHRSPCFANAISRAYVNVNIGTRSPQIRIVDMVSTRPAFCRITGLPDESIILLANIDPNRYSRWQNLFHGEANVN